MVGVDPMTVVNWERYQRLPRHFRKVRAACQSLGLGFERLSRRFA